MDILGKLFSSEPLVKIMRLFLMNSEEAFDNGDISERTKVKLTSVRTELNLLKSVGFIKKKSFVKEEIKKLRSKKIKIVKKKANGWILNDKFPYIKALNVLLVDTGSISKENLAGRFKSIGGVKLLISSGVFIGSNNSRVDLLIVGNKLKPRVVEEKIKRIEAEIGKQLIYSLFDTSEFIYRLDMCDKLVSDILEYPHVKVIDSIGTNLSKK